VPHTNTFPLLLVIATWAFFNTPAKGQVSSEPSLTAKAEFSGSALTCTQPIPSATAATTIRVPRALVERAKVKARLAFLLRESLFDDSSGIVNLGREKEIKKLANRLRRED
jgi:hypothetical protein